MTLIITELQFAMIDGLSPQNTRWTNGREDEERVAVYKGPMGFAVFSTHGKRAHKDLHVDALTAQCILNELLAKYPPTTE